MAFPSKANPFSHTLYAYDFVAELIPCIGILIEKLTAAQLVIKFTHSMESAKFVTVFTPL